MEPSAEPTDVAPSQDGGADQPDQRRSRTAAVRERYARARDRVDRSAAGHVQRRWRELDIMNHGLILASLGLTLLVPALITLAALFPVGSENGVAPVIHRFGLSSEATNDLRQLFPSRKRVAGTTT